MLLVEIVAILCGCGLPLVLAIVAVVMTTKSRHEERMKMIENGISLNQQKAPKRNPNRYTSLRNGLVLIGFSIGLVIGICLYPFIPDDSDFVELIVPAVTVLFGGIAYVIYFMISRNLEEKEIRAERSEKPEA